MEVDRVQLKGKKGRACRSKGKGKKGKNKGKVQQVATDMLGYAGFQCHCRGSRECSCAQALQKAEAAVLSETSALVDAATSWPEKAQGIVQAWRVVDPKPETDPETLPWSPKCWYASDCASLVWAFAICKSELFVSIAASIGSLQFSLCCKRRISRHASFRSQSSLTSLVQWPLNCGAK